MDTQKLLIGIGEQIGHTRVLNICKNLVDRGNDSQYLKRFTDANTDGDDCGSHVGDCGQCRDNVWYPCTGSDEKP